MADARRCPRCLSWPATALLAAAACSDPASPGGPDGPGAGQLDVAPITSGYLGGGHDDQIRDVAIDAAGNLYLTGGTRSPDFPVTAGAFQTTHNPGTKSAAAIEPYDVFVTKLSPTGAVIWSTFIGGPNYDRAYAIEVDANGGVYVAGRAGAGFPVTAGAVQMQFRGGQDAAFYGPQDGFVCRLTPDGGDLVFCTYFGTGDAEIVRDIDVAPDGEVLLVAAHESGQYTPEIEAAFLTGRRGDRDAVVARLSADGATIRWARHLGGTGRESGENSLRLDGAGNAVVLLTTESADAETTAGAAFRTYRGNGDFYVARVDATSGALEWATFLGGSQREATETHELAVAPDRTVYIAAGSASADFPMTAGALQPGYGGGPTDLAAARLSADGSTLLAATFLGGGGADAAEGVALDGAGNVYVTGQTRSADFPVTADALLETFRGDRDGLVAILSPDLSELLYSTYIGGGNEDRGRAAAFRQDRLLIGGLSSSPSWPRLDFGRPGYAAGMDAVYAVLGVVRP